MVGIQSADIRGGEEGDHRPGNQVPLLGQRNGQHRLEIESELPTVGRGQVPLEKGHVALGGNVPDGADRVVELLSNLLQVLRSAGLVGLCEINCGQAASRSAGQQQPQGQNRP